MVFITPGLESVSYNSNICTFIYTSLYIHIFMNNFCYPYFLEFFLCNVAAILNQQYNSWYLNCFIYFCLTQEEGIPEVFFRYTFKCLAFSKSLRISAFIVKQTLQMLIRNKFDKILENLQ